MTREPQPTRRRLVRIYHVMYRRLAEQSGASTWDWPTLQFCHPVRASVMQRLLTLATRQEER